MHGFPLLQVVAVAMLILANAFFVAAEFAMVSTRDTRIEQLLSLQGSRSRARFAASSRNSSTSCPPSNLGSPCVHWPLGWIGEPLAADIGLGWIEFLPRPPSHTQVYSHAFFHPSDLFSASPSLRTFMSPSGTGSQVAGVAACRSPRRSSRAAHARSLCGWRGQPCGPSIASAAIILRGFDIPMTERAAVHSPEELKLITTAARRLGLAPAISGDSHPPGDRT